MEEVMNDLGYQHSLETSIGDKMKIKSLIFNNAVYMAMIFPEILKDSLRPNGKAEVEYEGSTSILFVKGPFTIYDVQMAMCRALAISIQSGSDQDTNFFSNLVIQKMQETGMNSCDSMNEILKYIKNPLLLQGFFKVITMTTGEFQIHLA